MKDHVVVVDTRDKLHNYRKDPRVPFDRFYLVPESALENLQQLTPYALILPLSQEYAGALKDVDVGAAALRSMITRGYKVVVPIHMTRCSAGKRVSADQVRPTYMTNRRWWRNHAGLDRFIPENVTLSTPEGLISPMCMNCEYSLRHVSGECYVGTQDCLNNLKVEYKQMDEKAYDRAENRDLVRLKKAVGATE